MITPPAGFRALPLSITQLSLAAVLQCGQSFRWNIFPLLSLASGTSGADNLHPTHEYRLCLRDRVVCLRQSLDTLFYRSVLPGPPLSRTLQDEREAETLAWLRDYFQLDVDLEALYEQWGKRDSVFMNRQQRFSGIRVLRQDPFENLISFICSSNNNIARITKMVKALCRQYSPALIALPSPALTDDDSNDPSTQELTEAYHPFPPPSALAAPEVASTLRGLGFGYRAEFIQRTAQMLVEAHGVAASESGVEPAEKWLHSLRKMSTSDAREELLKFVGVGRKVADCVLLMSLDKREVIPVDTHVHQIAMKHYGVSGSSKAKSNMTPKLYDEVSSKLAAVWGDYAGWAHLVLFTSDLKSFSSYGLSTTAAFPKAQPDVKITSRQRKSVLATPSATPSPAGKRKRKQVQEATVAIIANEKVESSSTQHSDVELPALDDSSMADRVKRRRRVKVTIAAVALK
ncbi:N-glycosylase/DNA lyase [Wolfiporia cocos MD-104 SS10]|uniref:DNA-(apurinic or apyrimidinic site) lyase n=1 Tax=Wolfiporia cocos (strain MD-104) TaxID=742152 RepID=A0A2H3J6I4_WOLCO|nr:N-glycosylase/DNA lyase [Wolfiporia cocos MD-104 SS10]